MQLALPELLGVVFADFDDVVGPQIRTQWPAELLSDREFRRAAPFLIVDEELAFRTVSLRLENCQLLALPVRVRGAHYRRGVYLFAPTLVLSATADCAAFRRVLRKFALILAALETRDSYCSKKEHVKRRSLEGTVSQVAQCLRQSAACAVAVDFGTRVFLRMEKSQERTRDRVIAESDHVIDNCDQSDRSSDHSDRSSDRSSDQTGDQSLAPVFEPFDADVSRVRRFDDYVVIPLRRIRSDSDDVVFALLSQYFDGRHSLREIASLSDFAFDLVVDAVTALQEAKLVHLTPKLLPFPPVEIDDSIGVQIESDAKYKWTRIEIGSDAFVRLIRRLAASLGTARVSVHPYLWRFLRSEDFAQKLQRHCFTHAALSLPQEKQRECVRFVAVFAALLSQGLALDEAFRQMCRQWPHTATDVDDDRTPLSDRERFVEHRQNLPVCAVFRPCDLVLFLAANGLLRRRRTRVSALSEEARHEVLRALLERPFVFPLRHVVHCMDSQLVRKAHTQTTQNVHALFGTQQRRVDLESEIKEPTSPEFDSSSGIVRVRLRARAFLRALQEEHLELLQERMLMRDDDLQRLLLLLAEAANAPLRLFHCDD